MLGFDLGNVLKSMGIPGGGRGLGGGVVGFLMRGLLAVGIC